MESNRTYEGDPIDGTYDDISERPFQNSGSTVDVVELGEGNKENTEWLPSSVNPNHCTELQLKVLKAAGQNPLAGVRLISERSTASESTVLRVLRRYYPNHAAINKNKRQIEKTYNDLTERQKNIMDLYLEHGSFNSAARNSDFSFSEVQDTVTSYRHIAEKKGGDVPEWNQKKYVDLTQNQKNIIGVIEDKPKMSFKNIADEVGVSFQTVKKVVRKYDHILRQRGIDPSKVGHTKQMKPPQQKNYSDLTERAKQVVDYITSNHPNTLVQASEESGLDYSLVSRVVEKYEHILENKGVDVESIKDAKNKHCDEKSYSDLTETQKKCIEYLRENPEANQTEVAEYAGCSRGPVRNVIDNYSRFID